MTFEDECIGSHNRYRKAHGAEPLKKKRDLTEHAQNWANYIAKSGRFQHSSDSKFGENIAMTSRPKPSGEEITKMWYDEIHQYNFSRPGFKSGTGHFTQVVWRGTTHIGVGIASGPYGTFAVANYEPAGNITNPGYFEKNVLRSGGSVSPAGNSRRRHSSSSSSSSSSDDDIRRQPDSRRVQSGGNTETKVSTKIKEFVDSQGRQVRETTTTTTTITKKGGSTSTSTKTDVKTEYLSSGGRSSERRDDRLLDSFDNFAISDDKTPEKLSDIEKKKFRDECVKRHNELRKLHGAPSLRSSSSLDKKAQKWAEHLLEIRRLQHSDDRDVGENVAYKFASNQRIFSGTDVTDMWYDEVKKYNFKNPGFQSGTGHFTQVVWEASKEIGVGVAIDGRGTLFAVANYSPAGNFMNQFEKNVKPRK